MAQGQKAKTSFETAIILSSFSKNCNKELTKISLIFRM